jgi:hypothetical protein
LYCWHANFSNNYCYSMFVCLVLKWRHGV